MIGMGERWKKRDVAAQLLRAAGDLIENWADEDVDVADAREYVAKWLARLPGAAWDARLGPRPGP